MSGFMLGEKLGSSQQYNDKSERIPVTFIKTSSCYLIGLKDTEKHGYQSMQLGFGLKKNIKKSTFGTIKKAGIETPLRFLREFRFDKKSSIAQSTDADGKDVVTVGEQTLQIGQEIKPSLFFQKGDKVHVTATSKGKGFQGVVKRHGFAGGPRTHGQSDRERAPGSVGQTTTPGKIYKGKRMAGHMGQDTVTVRNLEVIAVNDDSITVKGLVPGSKGSLVKLVKAD